jgi:pyruvate/2-oxoglutarate/acetoin dehydrogenase E1 component
MKQMKYIDALREGLREEMLRDDKVFLFGECIAGEHGGAFAVTKGFDDEFGDQRVMQAPLSEAAIAGACVGSAAMGMRPVGEIMFGSLMTLIVDEIHNQAGTLHYLSGGKIKCPMVMRTSNWMRLISGPHHCGNIDAMWMNSPGIKAVSPSCAADAKGLIKAAIRDDDPVIFLEYSPLYTKVSDVPDDPDYIVPIGKADIKRKGGDVTVICYATTVPDALEVAAGLEKEGIDVEVLDLRTIIPYDKEAIKASVAKTGRVIIAYEGYKTGGVGAEISAFIAEECLEDLTAPILRVACKDVPNPSNAVLLDGIKVDANDISDAIRKVME